MQRTEALSVASDADLTVLDRSMRVEFWLTRSVGTMIYRMLVLNTGQVPWTLSRQLSVVFGPLLNEIQKYVPEITRVFLPDKLGRRVAPAEFSGDALMELYISFSLRKQNIDTKESLSDEFSRLDFVENLSDVKFQSQFYIALRILAELDKLFSKYDSGKNGRFSKGRNIFDSQPARIGFIVAIAQHVLGRPGMDRTQEDRSERIEYIEKDAGRLVQRLNSFTSEQLGNFLKLDVLSEILESVSKVTRSAPSVGP